MTLVAFLGVCQNVSKISKEMKEIIGLGVKIRQKNVCFPLMPASEIKVVYYSLITVTGSMCK